MWKKPLDLALALTAAALWLMAIPSYAADSNGTERGGGDEIAQSFMSTAQRALRKAELQKLDRSQLTLDPAELRQKLSGIRVESTDEKLIVNGIYVTAVNEPGNHKIILNRKRWESIPNENMRASLALHEILGALRIDDSGYKTSSLLIWGKKNPFPIASDRLKGRIVCVPKLNTLVKEKPVETTLEPVISDLAGMPREGLDLFHRYFSGPGLKGTIHTYGYIREEIDKDGDIQRARLSIGLGAEYLGRNILGHSEQVSKRNQTSVFLDDANSKFSIQVTTQKPELLWFIFSCEVVRE